jgi:chromosome segregation ATPase
MPEQIWLTYRELGERLGISADGARMKAKRHKWTATTDNEGSIRVCVPASLQANTRTNVPRRTVPERSAEQANEIKAMQAHLETLKQQASDHAAERERLLAEIERQRADYAADMELISRDVERTRAELDREREHGRELAGKLDAAHREHAAKIEALRTEMERPWWRRLIGR